MTAAAGELEQQRMKETGKSEGKEMSSARVWIGEEEAEEDEKLWLPPGGVAEHTTGMSPPAEQDIWSSFTHGHVIIEYLR